MRRRNAPRVGMVSLGCPKALVDSEAVLTHLKNEGYEISPSYQGADLVIVNTCGFIEAAVEESLQAIGEALEENGRVIVTGCLGVKADSIRQAHPAVLAVTGPHDWAAVLEAVRQHLPPRTPARAPAVPPQGVKLTPRHYAYLKISEGCNHHCTFCIIPSLRGRLVSRPLGEVMREAEILVENGVRELLVISQDTSAYGVDRRYRNDFWGSRPLRTRLPELVSALGSLGVWVRLHYVYPYPMVDELIPLMTQGVVLPYLDMPLQHASPPILKAMKRPGDVDRTLERILEWRRACPDLVLRSTFIAGFPGETERDFERLLDFLKQAELDRVGCFTYSAIEGAAANRLPDPVPEAVKEERQARLMACQETISARRLQRRLGSEESVLVDDVGRDGVAIARSYADSPEIDGRVLIAQGGHLTPGQFSTVRITGTDVHDLQAQCLD